MIKMGEEKEKIIVLAKTYPELSERHGPLVCVAGVNQYGEWRRLYPVPFKIWIDDEYRDLRFKKWDVIEVEVTKPVHGDPRKESRKIVNWKKIKIVDHYGKWDVRLHIIQQLLDPDVETVKNSNKSLGVIKPRVVKDFIVKERRRLRDQAELQVLEKMDGAATLLEYIEMGDKFLLPEVQKPSVRVERLPWIGYKFYCGKHECNGHEMMVIDWEAQELFRKYKTLPPVRQKLYTWMLETRNLYFIIGNTWRWHKSFMIIGLFYPPKEIKPVKPIKPLFKEKSAHPTILNYMKG